jgi:hypothetical protein
MHIPLPVFRDPAFRFELEWVGEVFRVVVQDTWALSDWSSLGYDILVLAILRSINKVFGSGDARWPLGNTIAHAQAFLNHAVEIQVPLEVLPVEVEGVNVVEVLLQSLSDVRFRKEMVCNKSDDGL